MAESIKELKDAIKEQTRQQAKLQRERERLNRASTGGSTATSMAAAGKSSAYITEIIKQRKENNQALRDVGKKITELTGKRDVAKDANTTMDRMAEAFRDGLSRFFGVDFKQTFLDGLTSIKEGLLSLSKKLVAGFKSLYKNLIKKPVGTLMDIITGAIKTAGLVIGFVKFLEGWQKATKWFGANADFGDKLASGLANLAGAFMGIDEDQRKELAKKMATFFDRVGETLQEILDGVRQTIMGLINGDSSEVKEGMRKVWDTIVDTALGGIRTALSSLTDNDERVEAVIGGLKKTFDKLFETGEAFFKFAQDLFGLLLGDSNSSWSKVWDSFKNLGEKILEAIDEGLNTIFTAVGLEDTYKDFKDGLQAVTDVLITIYDTIMSIPRSIKEMFQAIGQWVNNTVGFEIFKVSKDSKAMGSVNAINTIRDAKAQVMTNTALSKAERDKLLAEIEKIENDPSMQGDAKRQADAINAMFKDFNSGLSKMESGLTVKLGVAENYEQLIGAIKDNQELSANEKSALLEQATAAKSAGTSYNDFKQSVTTNNNLAILTKPKTEGTVMDNQGMNSNLDVSA